MHVWPWRHCILNTRKSTYVEWPIYVVHSSWNALQESGEQFGIHQAKNVVFFQIQVAFSALRHWVSDNRRGFFLATDPANGTELLLFLVVQQDVSANTSAFCFSGIAEQLWGFCSHVMLLWVLWSNTSAGYRQEVPIWLITSTGSGSGRGFAPHWSICARGVESQHIVPQEAVMAILWPLFISWLCVGLVWTLAYEMVWAILVVQQ